MSTTIIAEEKQPKTAPPNPGATPLSLPTYPQHNPTNRHYNQYTKYSRRSSNCKRTYH